MQEVEEGLETVPFRCDYAGKIEIGLFLCTIEVHDLRMMSTIPGYFVLVYFYVFFVF